MSQGKQSEIQQEIQGRKERLRQLTADMEKMIDMFNNVPDPNEESQQDFQDSVQAVDAAIQSIEAEIYKIKKEIDRLEAEKP